MEVHHIQQEAEGGPDTFENAIPLCFDCHANVKAYNPRHPKGIMYTESELKQHRDKWYAKIDSSSAIIAEPEIREIDKKTYFKLKEYLPNNIMHIIRDIDFGGWSLGLHQLDKVEFFPRLVEDPVFEYLDADLEAAKSTLAESIKKFVNDSLPYLHSDDGINLLIPRDWELTSPDVYEKAIDILNNDTFDIWYKYCDYIKLCRRKLLVDE